MKRWPTKVLTEIATVVRGVSFDKSQVSDNPRMNSIPILRAGNIQGSLLTDSDLVYVPEDLVSAEQLMRRGDIAICMSSGSPAIVGKTAHLASDWHGSVGAFCAIVRFKSGYHHRFGSYFFRSPAFLEWRDSNAKGANIQNLRRAELEHLSLPVPPLAEQERIVKLLDEADELRKLRAQADRRTANLIPALFHEMFGDPITNSKKLPIATLEEIAFVERGKFTPRPRNDPSFFGGSYPFIQTGDISESGGFLTRWQQTLNEKGASVSREFPVGTVVIAIVGATIGETAILGIPVFCTDSVVGIRPNPSKTFSEYIWAVLRQWQPVFVAQTPETARANLNLAIIKPLKVPLPPLPLQKEFAQRVAEIRELEEKQAASRLRLDNLFQSMLHRAFHGEL